MDPSKPMDESRAASRGKLCSRLLIAFAVAAAGLLGFVVWVIVAISSINMVDPAIVTRAQMEQEVILMAREIQSGVRLENVEFSSTDGWGNRLRLEPHGESWLIRSAGGDGRFLTGDDLVLSVESLERALSGDVRRSTESTGGF